MTNQRKYHTLMIEEKSGVCFLRFDRPKEKNSINMQMAMEFSSALDDCAVRNSVVVLEGADDYFCFGADFGAMNEFREHQNPGIGGGRISEVLYETWRKLNEGPYITIAHVKGKVNAGGIGFVSACDVVIANDSASFGLSELLFGLLPACVLPFLIRRVGFQKAHYMALMTKPIDTKTAFKYSLVDAHSPDSDMVLSQHLARFRCLNKNTITRYKRYMCSLATDTMNWKPLAIEANSLVFSDEENIDLISRYTKTGILPWEHTFEEGSQESSN